MILPLIIPFLADFSTSLTMHAPKNRVYRSQLIPFAIRTDNHAEYLPGIVIQTQIIWPSLPAPNPNSFGLSS